MKDKEEEKHRMEKGKGGKERGAEGGEATACEEQGKKRK